MSRSSAHRPWKGRGLWATLAVAALAATLLFLGNSSSTANAQTCPVDAGNFPSIQAAIDSLRNTGGCVSIPAGVHVVSKKVRLYSNIMVVGAGIDQTIITPAAGMDDHLMADDSQSSRDTGIEVWNLTLRGLGPRTRSAMTGCCHGLRFVNLTDSKIINVKSENHSMDGIYLGYNNNNNVTNVRVSGCALINNWRNGISLTHGTGNIIDHCVVENNNLDDFAPGGIVLEPDEGLEVSGNIVAMNTARQNFRGIALYAARGRLRANQGENSICRNIVTDNRMSGVYDFNGKRNVYVVLDTDVVNNGSNGLVNFLLPGSADVIRSGDANFLTPYVDRYCPLDTLPAAPQKPASGATSRP